MTPHETTPALAPARVEQHAIVGDGTLIFDSHPSRERMEELLPSIDPKYSYEPLRIVRLLETRPGDVFLPSEAREGAVRDVTDAIGRVFNTFGGGRAVTDYNPIAHALRDQPLSFAATVPVADVVRFVLDALARPSGEEVVDLRAQLAACQKMVQMVEASEARRTEERNAAEHALARLEALAVDEQGVTIRRAPDGTLHVTTGQPPVYATTHVAPTLREVFDVERPTTAALPPRPSGADATEVGHA